MSLNKQKWRFVRSLVQDAPEHGGVYVLWAGDKVICIGRAEGGRDTLRGCLMQLLEGKSGEVQHATHYSWELCRNPVQREAELLRDLVPHAQRVDALRKAPDTGSRH